MLALKMLIQEYRREKFVALGARHEFRIVQLIRAESIHQPQITKSLRFGNGMA
jgi:hypothetical protein